MQPGDRVEQADLDPTDLDLHGRSSLKGDPVSPQGGRGLPWADPGDRVNGIGLVSRAASSTAKKPARWPASRSRLLEPTLGFRPGRRDERHSSGPRRPRWADHPIRQKSSMATLTTRESDQPASSTRLIGAWLAFRISRPRPAPTRTCQSLPSRSRVSSPRVNPTRPSTRRTARRVPDTYGPAERPAS